MSSQPDDKFLDAAKTLKALGHALRLEIVCGLRGQPCTQTYIAEVLGIPQSTVAQHLKVLRSQGIVRAERSGVEVMFSLADSRLAGVLEALCGGEGGVDITQFSWAELAQVERDRRSNGAY